jgi:hypothetical protein
VGVRNGTPLLSGRTCSCPRCKCGPHRRGRADEHRVRREEENDAQALRVARGSGLVLAGSGQVDAAVTCNYAGRNFTDVIGSAPQVTTNNRIGGFVAFATPPTANGTKGKAEVLAFGLTDGARTLSSARGGFGVLRRRLLRPAMRIKW